MENLITKDDSYAYKIYRINHIILKWANKYFMTFLTLTCSPILLVALIYNIYENKITYQINIVMTILSFVPIVLIIALQIAVLLTYRIHQYKRFPNHCCQYCGYNQICAISEFCTECGELRS